MMMLILVSALVSLLGLVLWFSWGTGLLRRFVAVVLLFGGVGTLLSVVYFEYFHGR
ncbi:hypothetical protein [Pyxidicoccus caerfyrddinensis]|uniref:hypothetical protein n=1 Tax=Pyxidicoccus caerfyrddinensis TaxID=2709663 RepID=UPI0013D9F736|nr:hypothetical protein [Pyxidicoccus caerfyrddinensis]